VQSIGFIVQFASSEIYTKCVMGSLFTLDVCGRDIDLQVCDPPQNKWVIMIVEVENIKF
jgi:hypothetical protein